MSTVAAEKRRIRRHIENLGSVDERVATKAEACLIRYYGPRAFDELRDACHDPNAAVRFRAVWALAQTRATSAYETILALTDDPDERVRYDATVALGVLGDARAVEPLERMWAKNDSTRPAATAFERLGVEALPVIENVYRRGAPEVRRQAVDVLGHFAKENSARAVELLTEGQDDTDALIREEVQFWLHELGVA